MGAFHRLSWVAGLGGLGGQEHGGQEGGLRLGGGEPAEDPQEQQQGARAARQVLEVVAVVVGGVEPTGWWVR